MSLPPILSILNAWRNNLNVAFFNQSNQLFRPPLSQTVCPQAAIILYDYAQGSSHRYPILLEEKRALRYDHCLQINSKKQTSDLPALVTQITAL